LSHLQASGEAFRGSCSSSQILATCSKQARPGCAKILGSLCPKRVVELTQLLDIQALNMVDKKIFSLSSLVKNNRESSLAQIVSVSVLLIVIIVTLVFENRIVGMQPGYDDIQPKHHGWVTANTLAIISKATPENYFVGYALAYRDDQNRAEYEYFDRYPVFFSALFNRALSLSTNLADQLFRAKQIMNVIFLGTLILAVLLLEKLTGNKPVALATGLLAFSNPYLLWYKDMVHFDQPALFGFLLLIYAIALYKLDGKRIPVYIATFVAIGMGRGYASYSILFLWLALESYIILRTKALEGREKIRNILRHPSFFLSVLAMVWGASLLLYNIIVEARIRDVSILQTSILRSARYRLSLNPQFNLENEGVINWWTFAESQVQRVVQWSFPLKGMDFGLWINSLILLGMFLIMGIMIWKQPTEKRIVYLTLIFSGFGWLIPLRNLAAFHDYTAMYYIGIPLVFFLSVATLLKPPKFAAYVVVFLMLILYVSAIFQVQSWHEERTERANEYTYDFVRILEKIEGTGKNINMPERIPYGPFPPGFYLSEHYLTSPEVADYVVTRNRKYSGENLTPDNDVIYLFRK
jgi:hypothetical protein